jgi:hypothetical protein
LPSTRALEDEQLRPKVVEAFKVGRGTYGSPRVLDELIDQGFEVGRRRVARLIRQLGLQGVMPRKFRVTTDSDHEHPIAQNMLGRNFEASGRLSGMLSNSSRSKMLSESEDSSVPAALDCESALGGAGEGRSCSAGANCSAGGRLDSISASSGSFGFSSGSYSER